MEPTAQGAPRSVTGYYLWEPEGGPAIHLHLAVIDRLVPEIMRGFGAVPKRGAEVGGILLGSIEKGERVLIRVEEFEAVPCTYKRGPSFQLTDEDGAAFEDAVAAWQPDPARPLQAVGFYRSHTRDGMTLAPEDIDLMDRFFPDAAQIALLVKPFATKASIAGFFARRNGLFPGETALEFPMRRQELTGEEPPRRRPLTDRRGREAVQQPEEAPAQVQRGARYDSPLSYGTPGGLGGSSSGRQGLRAGWVWIPLSFIFLLLGVILGFQSALTMAPKAASKEADFSLALNVTRTGDNLTVRWNRDSQVIRGATKGLLEIEDGGYDKPVDLDLAHLQSGSIIYHNSSNTVHFRLIVSLSPRLTVTETLDWRR